MTSPFPWSRPNLFSRRADGPVLRHVQFRSARIVRFNDRFFPDTSHFGSLKGNTKSAAFLLNRHHAMTSNEPDESSLGEDEQTVLETYLKKYQSELNPKKDDLP
jgi:hypothetical protein